MRNGQVIVGAVAASDGRGVQPLRSVTWLHETLGERGARIEAGDVICTGSCTALSQVVPGNRYRARIGDVGEVELRTE